MVATLKIDKYMVVNAIAKESLAIQVDQAIREGWQPLGGVAVTFNETDRAYILWQAMVTYHGAISA